ncbi:MAG: ABC transporter ATP-binding protein [bacterium]
MSNILIETKDLKKEFVNDELVTKILYGITFTIHEGEFVSIMGPSGSGKSTLMHILGFLDKTTSGIYKYKDHDVNEFSDEELADFRNREVGFVFQSFNLLPRTTVFDNVKLPLNYSKKIKDSEKNDRVKEVIESVGLSHRLNNFSNQLSGGEKQRVAIARALVNKPSVIFADEPTGNLDSKSGAQIMGLIEKLNDEGKTIILVTHEQDTAQHAKRVVKLKDGLIIGDYEVMERSLNGLRK